ncbi:MAG TPA: nodulation protein NfeD, partial [Spirochaetia bacterium]|nr:nodulation protein NfeD [Spirochaetia bacterium]
MSRFISVISLALMICIFPSAEESSSGGEKAYVIEIHGEIDRAMMVFIRRGIGQSKTGGAAALIFDIDTFGGRVDSALQITSLIGSVDSMPTIAFVPATPEGTGVSWSAGALISFSCSRIYMAPGTSMGAAAPVYQTQEGMDMAPEKVVSALRTQMAALAEKNGYPKGIALAMVDKDVELWEAYLGGNLLILTPQEFELEEKKAASEGKKLQKGKPIILAGKLLTLTAGEMLTYGVSSGTVPDLAILLADLGLAHAEPVYLHQNVPDRIVTVLTSSAVTSLLVIIGLIALFMEVTSPGFGIPGTTAIVCFSILFVSHFLLGTVGSLELIIFLCGVVLLILEIFIIPGFG